MNSFQEIFTDVLVIGGGSAAAMAAIRAKEAGSNVLIVTKAGLPSGCSPIARSGFQAAMGYSNPADNPEVHYKDTLEAGNELNNSKLVKRMTEEIIRIVHDLDSWGVELIKENGKYSQRHRVGCTYPRHLHNYDNTGKYLMNALKNKVKSLNINVMTNSMTIDIIEDNGSVFGALVFDYKNGQWYLINAKAIVIATGGAGGVYSVTDNPPGMTGDGYAMALRTQLKLIDMEMIDFQLLVCYPKTMNSYPPNSSAWIAAGARFYNGLGERFMKKHQPDKLEKTTRAMINRAVGIEIHDGRATKNGGVYLDLSSIPTDEIESIGPTISKVFAKNYIDLTYQPMELAPGSHTFLGGIQINEDGATDIKGLYAAGEVAGGIHGANRLGGNAITDPLVFGDLAGTSASNYAQTNNKKSFIYQELLNKFNMLLEGLINNTSKDIASIKGITDDVRNIMSEHVGIVRSKEKLESAIQKLTEIEFNHMPNLKIRGSNKDELSLEIKNYFELKNIIVVGKAIAKSALVRNESRGAHYRKDYPQLGGSEWIKHVGVKIIDDDITVDLLEV